MRKKSKNRQEVISKKKGQIIGNRNEKESNSGIETFERNNKLEIVGEKASLPVSQNQTTTRAKQTGFTLMSTIYEGKVSKWDEGKLDRKKRSSKYLSNSAKYIEKSGESRRKGKVKSPT